MLIDATQKTKKIGTPQMFLVAVSRKSHPSVILRNVQCATWQAAVKQTLDEASTSSDHTLSLSNDPAVHNDEYSTVGELATTLYLLNGTGLSVCVVRPAVLDVNTGYVLEPDITPVSSTTVRVIAEVIELDRETVYEM